MLSAREKGICRRSRGGEKETGSQGRGDRDSKFGASKFDDSLSLASLFTLFVFVALEFLKIQNYQIERATERAAARARERETGIVAGIPGFQGNKKQPNSDRWNAAATTTTKTGLETKKKKTGFVAFLQRFVVAAQRKM